MKQFRNYFLRLFSTAFVCLFAFTNFFSFVSNAQTAGVEIVKDASTVKAAGKRTLTGPCITNFDAPAFNDPLYPGPDPYISDKEPPDHHIGA